MKSSLFTPFSLAPDGFIMLAAKGEHPWLSDDGEEKIVQIVDDASLAAQVAAFNRSGKELLLDYDHESYDMDKRTTAAGWITNVEVRPDGLYGKVRWSECGLSDVTGGNFRFTSPTYLRSAMVDLGSDHVRPVSLDTVALTNRPNMRGMRPITNHARGFVKNYGTSEGATKGWATRRGAGGGSVKEVKAKGGSGKAARKRLPLPPKTGSKVYSAMKSSGMSLKEAQDFVRKSAGKRAAQSRAEKKSSLLPSLPSPDIGFGSKSLKQSLGEKMGRAKAATKAFAESFGKKLKGRWS